MLDSSLCKRQTAAPACASAIAHAAPMPRVPPVTKAVRPANENRDRDGAAGVSAQDSLDMTVSVVVPKRSDVLMFWGNGAKSHEQAARASERLVAELSGPQHQ